jgi:hypothetical protein
MHEFNKMRFAGLIDLVLACAAFRLQPATMLRNVIPIRNLGFWR